MRFLLFQLYGVMQSWGSPAVGLVRNTEDHPTKSGVMGLIAACLGIDYSQEEDMLGLQKTFGFGCREDIPGEILEDFHTVRTETSLKDYFDTLRKEKAKEKESLLILTTRYYLTGAFFTVCIWENSSTDKFRLDKVSEALSYPVYTPYLGRKCCLLGLPFGQAIVGADSLKGAFSQYVPDRFSLLPKQYFSKSPRVFWEGADSSIPVKAVNNRFDTLLSRRTWSYTSRKEYEGILKGEDYAIQK